MLDEQNRSIKNRMGQTGRPAAARHVQCTFRTWFYSVQEWRTCTGCTLSMPIFSFFLSFFLFSFFFFVCLHY